MKILQQLRRDLAIRYLDDRKLHVSKIAWLLRFREVSALTRGSTAAPERRRDEDSWRSSTTSRPCSALGLQLATDGAWIGIAIVVANLVGRRDDQLGPGNQRGNEGGRDIAECG
jgi:hypothetical protein